MQAPGLQEPAKKALATLASVFHRDYDTPGVKRLKRERGAPDQPECDLSRIAIKLRRVHLFRARYFMGAWAGTHRG
jgi:hypothetical protein